MEVNEVM